MLLVTAFVGILVLTFAVVAIVLRPTAEQKAVDKRLSTIRVASGYLTGAARNTEIDLLLKEASKGNFGWLEDIVQKFQFAQKTQLLILQANAKFTVGTLVMWCAGCGLGSFLLGYMVTAFWPIALGVALVGAYVPFGVLSFRRTKRINKFNSGLADAIDMMARALRAGHSMVAAIGIVAEHGIDPVGPEFGEVFRKQNFGLSLRDAMMQLLDRVPSQDLRVVVTGILVQKDTGGNLAEILDRTVHVIRERIRIQGEIRTHTAQGRMTGWILCALPPIMLVLINLINPGYSKPLTTDPFGRIMLYVGVGLLLVGGFIIRQIVNGIEI